MQYKLPQSKPDGFASSLGEGASGAPGHFALEPVTLPPCQRPHLRGGWHRVAMTGGVQPERANLHCGAYTLLAISSALRLGTQ